MSLFHQVLQRTGRADKTVDTEFDDGLAQHQRSKDAIENLARSTKRYGDSLRVLNSTQLKLASDLAKGTPDIAESDFVKALADLLGTNMSRSTRDHELCVRQIFQDPFSRYSKLFPSINDLVKARAHNMLKFDRARYKYSSKKQKEEHQMVASARAEYEKLNSILITEFKELFDATAQHFIPSFRDFMQTQVKLYTVLLETATHDTSMCSMVEGVKTEDVRCALDEIRVLAIVADKEKAGGNKR